MASDDPIRASDADREVVVATLREAYTAGRLNLDEFDERTTAAYESKTWGDLRKLTADLPSQPILGGDVPGRLFHSAVSEPRLPSHPSRAPLPTPSPSRRGSPMPFLIPLIVWIILAMHNASGSGAAVVVALLVGTVVLMSAVRRR
ncbi:MAG TPA: DUF1707 domain-containing protein [Trebonia sp.]|jgi:Domain of unknown function (DUF1707)